jgi:hypothetical protein
MSSIDCWVNFSVCLFHFSSISDDLFFIFHILFIQDLNILFVVFEILLGSAYILQLLSLSFSNVVMFFLSFLSVWISKIYHFWISLSTFKFSTALRIFLVSFLISDICFLRLVLPDSTFWRTDYNWKISNLPWLMHCLSNTQLISFVQYRRRYFEYPS